MKTFLITCPEIPKREANKPRTRDILLHNSLALGDTVIATALVRDLRARYGSQYRVGADGHYRSVWLHNPHLTPVAELVSPLRVELNYSSGIQCSKAGQRIHCLAWTYQSFKQLTGIEVSPVKPRGDLHLSPAEQLPLIKGRYWVLMAGHKRDAPLKQWPVNRYQVLVDQLNQRGIQVVQTGSVNSPCFNPVLHGVLDLVGKTENVRDLFTLIYHADGVICGVTAAMHIAAAFEKPCAVLAGGREEPWWEHYTNSYRAFGPHCQPVRVEHRFLHTLGKLECCQAHGCWKHYLTPPTRILDPKQRLKARTKLCTKPVSGPEVMPQCMALIDVEDALTAVLSYIQPEVAVGKIAAKTNPLALGMPPPLVELPGLTTSLPPTPAPLPAPQDKPLEVLRPFGAERLRPEISLPQARGHEPPELAILDHPLLGGKMTVCVLCYGPYSELAERCLSSILRSVPPSRLDLRIALNACCPATVAYVRTLPAIVYEHRENRKKYPVMRAMFRDPEKPITTPYLTWFDDDSHVIDDLWLSHLARAIIDNHNAGKRLYGVEFYHDLARLAKGGRRPDLWFKRAPWWRNRPLRLKGGREAPNGSVIKFVAGGFWAVDSALITEADIPCARLQHNGGDIALAAAVYQAGYDTCMFNQGKKYIYTSHHERRGYHEPFPWTQVSG